jgi:hypothetical protein
MFAQVALPSLPTDLTNRLIQYAKDKFYDVEIQQLWQTQRAYPFTSETLEQYNIVERISFNIETYLDEVKAIIEPQLPIEAHYQLFVMRNIRPSRMAIFPAHTDRKRGVALNYVLQPGGNSVKLHFHEQAASIGNTFFNEIEAPIIKTFDTENDAWGALNARAIHSVTDIEDDRILFTLSPVDQDLSFDDFIAKMNQRK